MNPWCRHLLRSFLGMALLLLPMACAGPPAPVVGGPCTYAQYTGTATVTDLQPAQSGYWMYFTATFVGAQPASSFYNPNADAVFVSNPAGATTLDWLSSKGIVVGATFDLKLSLETSGSCTPVMHAFPALGGITH